MNITEIKRRVPIHKFLQRQGVQIGSMSMSGWTPVNCPFHRDENPSASFSVRKDRFNCHACGVRGDVIELSKVVSGIEDTSEVLKWIQDKYITPI